jgi:CO/xanthine dehydrogenase Mo-binding subunit
MLEPLVTVGRANPRLDALERVTGRARYSADVKIPGMLYARVLRSPHPHARIVRIDAARALALTGVSAVITHENCKLVWASGDTANTRYVFNNPVRYFGDAVAVVAASDRHLAEQALKLISVEYEVLPFVLDAEKALADGAVEVQPGGNLIPRNGPPGTPRVREPSVYTRGNLEQGFAAADVVVEGHYVTKHHNNAQMELRVALAQWEGGKLTVYTPTQGVTNCRDDIAAAFGLERDQVRVVCEYMGGGFGNKNQCQDTDLMAAELARVTEKPVMLELTRKEDWLGIHGRWPTTQHYRVGAKRDGTLTAIDFRGYAGMGPHRKSSGDIAGLEFYRCPNVRKELYTVFTNMTTSANYRAPAYPQGVFGIASALDDVCHRLTLDPLEFYRVNATREWQDQTPYTSSGLMECLERGAAAFDWQRRWRPAASDTGAIKRGVGLAIGAFGAGLGRSSAVLRLDGTGVLHVHVGVTDIGTGAKTTMAMIAAEAMSMPLEQVRVVWGDTDRAPYSVGESGSRTSIQTGDAVVAAAADLKAQIAQRGRPSGTQVLIAEATTNPRIEGAQRSAFAAHFVEVEVDTELGSVRPTKFVAAHDSGRIVNPLTAASQVRGGVIQGIGMALHEELAYDKNTGIQINPGYYGARIMTHMDTLPIQIVWVEPEDAYGPFGIKSIGEATIIPVVGAIANAVFNATGVRMTELPLNRERVLTALNGARA